MSGSVGVARGTCRPRMELNRVGLPDDYERAVVTDMRVIQQRVREITAQRDTPYVIPAQQLPSFVVIYNSLVRYLNDHDQANLATDPRVSPEMYTELIDWLNSHAPYETTMWPYRRYGRENRLKRSHDDDVLDGICGRWALGPTDLSRLRL